MERYIKNGRFYNGSSIIAINDEGALTIFNPDEETLLANGWEVYIEPELTPQELFNNAKEDLVLKIRQYNDSSNVNSFTINGKSMWLDHNTRLQLKVSIDAYAATGAETVSKWFDGVQYTFPTQNWIAMLALLEVYAGEAQNVTDAHLAAVDQLNTIEEVLAFDYTAGYPEKLVF